MNKNTAYQNRQHTDDGAVWNECQVKINILGDYKTHRLFAKEKKTRSATWPPHGKQFVIDGFYCFKNIRCNPLLIAQFKSISWVQTLMVRTDLLTPSCITKYSVMMPMTSDN